MASTLKHADGLVKRNREISQSLLELGQSLSILGQSEGDSLGKGIMEVRPFLCYLEVSHSLTILTGG